MQTRDHLDLAPVGLRAQDYIARRLGHNRNIVDCAVDIRDIR